MKAVRRIFGSVAMTMPMPMPMLLVFAAAMMALILSATVVIAVDATSAQTAVPCKDNQDFIFGGSSGKNKQLKKGKNKNKNSNEAPSKDCDWVGKAGKRRKKLCKKNKKVIEACPETCGVCSDENENENLENLGNTECPKKFTSRKFSKKGGDCSDYKTDLECNYNFQFFYACGSSSNSNSNDLLQCYPADTYTCNNNVWQLSSFETFPCVGPPPSKDLPIGEACDPTKDKDKDDKDTDCPLVEPAEKSACREQQVGLGCTYNFQYIGCSYAGGGLSCIPLTTYSCIMEKELEQEQETTTSTFIWEASTLIPLPCFDPEQGLPTGGTKQCDACPTVEPADQCPVKEPTIGDDCSDFIVVKGTNTNTNTKPAITDLILDCKYNFLYTGCSEDELQCAPGNMYTCSPEDGTWREGMIADPDQEFCPRRCPKSKPTFNLEDCVSEMYEDGLECEYDFRFTGCTDADQKCSPMEFYECTFENGWLMATVDQQKCSGPVPDGFGQSCLP